MITVDEQQGVFLLSTDNTSYVFGLVKGAAPTHIHWGPLIPSLSGIAPSERTDRPFGIVTSVRGEQVNLGSYPSEYPWFGSGDFRTPAWQASDSEGYPIVEPWFEGFEIRPGKPPLEGLPSASASEDGGTESLVVNLRDRPSGLKIELSYSVFPEYDVITRSVRFINEGARAIRLSRAASLCLDFENRSYDLLSLYGAWGRETHLSRHRLAVGTHSIGSRTGTTSHYANPFVAVASPSATEQQGEVRAAALVYSGNFRAEVERSSGDQLRLLLGVNPDGFSWLLEPGERFATPEAIMVYTPDGFSAMSRIFHRFIRERVMKSRFRDKPRPILVNNWEATYFSFTHDSLVPIVDSAAEMGIELFVLDDGWFGQRDDDTSGLGDWFVNRRKLPKGLDGLAAEVSERGLRLGLWFEPEMVSPDSELYRAHPDWCLHIPEREKPLGRNQLVLDFSREEVCDEIIHRVSAILASAPISYVKWDMNRYHSFPISPALPAERRAETAHRYVLGLYRVMEELTQRHPEVLFAGCSGGGGRFDAGILAYMPQIWASDNTDAVERMRIQYGLSLVYPICAIEAHVTNIPNHQVGRLTPFATRGNVAMSANFGFELDLSKLEDSDRKIAAKLVAFYKQHRELIQFGELVRLRSPFEGDGNSAAWMFVDTDRAIALVFMFELLSVANREIQYLPLAGLKQNLLYQIEWVDSGDTSIMGYEIPRRSDPYSRGVVSCYGAELMSRGLELPWTIGDFTSFRFLLSATE